MKRSNILLLLLAIMAWTFISCSDDDDFQDEEFESASAEILSFEFEELQPPISANINDNESLITATLPFGTDFTDLVPTIQISNLASISPPSGEPNDFSEPVVYLVTAEDGTQREWTVQLSEAEADAEPRLVLGDPVWNLTPSGNGVPSFFQTDGERGLAYRDGRVLITNNNDQILLLSAADGSNQGELNMEGVDGGSPKIADVAVSTDGSILACNTVEWTSNEGGEATTFKVYKWSDENSAPEVFISYTNTQFRMGDSFTVVGDISGEAEIYTAFGRKFLPPADRGSKIFKWTVSGGQVSDEPEIIEVTSGIPTTARFGSRPHVQPLNIGGGNLIVNANDIEFSKVSRNGDFINRIPNQSRNLWDGFTSYFQIFEFNERTLIATAFPRSDVESRLIVVDITNGIENVTPDNVVLSENFMSGASAIANINASGAVAVNASGNSAQIYCLITNQGIVRYDLRLEFE
ncbi:MAG: DUF5018 domain-containing protein [Cyclobacteriaceae bacterium]|nr:DUF5018 domain-containing protein [Cyclobacteriaceae bacterium]MCH8516336.1 DUF5018 domain-containing protein [Cyclobacteriaceae bacterium]